MKIIKGDATQPELRDGKNAIIHVCNNVGGWGAGFVLAISKRWEEPEDEFRRIYAKFGLQLGYIQIVKVEERLDVINMIAQNGYGEGFRHLNYEALAVCLDKIAKLDYSCIHLPYLMGSALAGGEWSIVKAMVDHYFKDLEVIAYNYENVKG